jgi:hypothetical protein
MTRPKLYKDKARIQIVCEQQEKELLEERIKKIHARETMSGYIMQLIRRDMIQNP